MEIEMCEGDELTVSSYGSEVKYFIRCENDGQIIIEKK